MLCLLSISSSVGQSTGPTLTAQDRQGFDATVMGANLQRAEPHVSVCIEQARCERPQAASCCSVPSSSASGVPLCAYISAKLCG